ncbi:MAG: hypothetical protein PHE04_06385 [Bacteroidales bacterium]|jgi:outer membrane murein-binding lipoprotein Lpp|nr:hypothetical protein [Bacteroidales bacterium]MDD3430667.1 hypothetical protein [Bacteroidales bacterium]MDD4361996.1 hypothetical protein [Bacteroidales bacterium]MDD4431879.1 hypothetical protein [Bacteroidales bacterium]
MKRTLLFSVLAAGLLLFSSCKSQAYLMKESTPVLELDINDFKLSDQVNATATRVQILGVDWEALFNSKTGYISPAVPVLGGFLPPLGDKAIYKLMEENPGYDVVIYPQFETKVKRFGLVGLIYRKITVKATARLGKLK